MTPNPLCVIKLLKKLHLPVLPDTKIFNLNRQKSPASAQAFFAMSLWVMLAYLYAKLDKVNLGASEGDF